MSCTNSLIFAAVSFCILVMNQIACAADAQAQQSQQCGGFITSCKEPFDHSQGFLQGTCKTDKGRWVVTSIDLDPHISNVNGNMVLGNGYKKTCQDFGYARSSTSFIAAANCTKFDGKLRRTGFDVNTRISNQNGRLNWDKNCGS
ncbi:hypothetical protein R1flu_012169 [Riccia fluitans]|uniref:Cyanovirin-N domain-containing protein n=1 Tax=Riccia fluitans TaxID=41844 RepID=A0ABD1ZDZ5_9MARC